MNPLFSASRQIRKPQQLVDLNGAWEFTPEGEKSRVIEVPALWESQADLRLDGQAQYRREFEISKEQLTGFATLRFEAVMDSAQVWLNGHSLGSHHNPFTPFEIKCDGFLVVGKNTIEVKVMDHPRDSVEHIRSAHGKQGWANQEFPSPPSVYMTLGGIYRDVTLHLHHNVVIRNIMSDSNPNNLGLCVEIENLTASIQNVILKSRVFGQEVFTQISLPANAISICNLSVDSKNQERWSPESPHLHLLEISLLAYDKIIDQAMLRIGLRTVEQKDGKILINGEELFIRAALVQGFYPDTIYGEPDDAKIRDEVSKAMKLGLNTLRLHIKAFDTRYLDICDELGMLLHCDIPIAEPIAHDELGRDSDVGKNCADAIRAQVKRDYSHPSIFLWSAMNELGLEKIEVRGGAGYKSFAVSMYETLLAADETRPIIENDWIDPDPEFVFRSQILTSHWYGRLDSRYLKSLRDRTEFWGRDGRFFYISEFGDWGLPSMPPVDDSEFWSYHDYYKQSIADLPWSASLQELVDGTQTYMGISDKLQIEIFRSTDGVNGFCVTEFTDIPWELNGLLDYRRNIKPGVFENFSKANQEVLPILEFDYAGVTSGVDLPLTLHIHNSSPQKRDFVVCIRFESGAEIRCEVATEGYAVSHTQGLSIKSGVSQGLDKLSVSLLEEDQIVADNFYIVPIYPSRGVAAGDSFNLLGKTGLDILHQLQIENDSNSQKYVVGENSLTPELKIELAKLLYDGASVLVMAQDLDHSRFLPIEVGAIRSTTEWGGTDFHFTTAHSELFSTNSILTIEDLNIRPDAIFSQSQGSAWPDVTHAGVFKPMPRPRTGYIVGETKVGKGRLITCQYRLNETKELGSTQDIALSVLRLLR